MIESKPTIAKMLVLPVASRILLTIALPHVKADAIERIVKGKAAPMNRSPTKISMIGYEITAINTANGR